MFHSIHSILRYKLRNMEVSISNENESRVVVPTANEGRVVSQTANTKLEDILKVETPVPKTIRLNVGGKIFEVSIDTLKPSKYFTSYIERWMKDDSPIFIDRSWVLFDHVLSFLRNPDYPYPLELLEALNEEFIFYGIGISLETPQFIQKCGQCNSDNRQCVTCKMVLCKLCEIVCSACKKCYCTKCMNLPSKNSVGILRDIFICSCGRNCCPSCIIKCVRCSKNRCGNCHNGASICNKCFYILDPPNNYWGRNIIRDIYSLNRDLYSSNDPDRDFMRDNHRGGYAYLGDRRHY